MHKDLLKNANQEQLINISCYLFHELKKYDEKAFKMAEIYLYQSMYGDSFNKALSEMAVEEMVNEDGSSGGHFSLEDATNIARRYDIPFTHFNEYDWYYVLNMIYSDYYGAVGDDTAVYVNLAKKFLMDKDAKEGKALKYYLAMH